MQNVLTIRGKDPQMLRANLVAALVSLMVNSVSLPLLSVNAGEERDLPFVSLGKSPKFQDVIETELTKELREKVSELFDELAVADIPLEFFSNQLSDQYVQNCSLLTGHDNRSEVPSLPSALTRLIDLGPTILPLLLNRLDDAAPVRTRVSADGDMTICFAQRLHGNPANLREARILNMSKSCYTGELAVDDQGNRTWRPPQISQAEGYQFRIGDVCFATIGRIVGRDYQCLIMDDAFTYAICSPVIDQRIREKVNSVWNDARPCRRVYQSLMYDFLTIGIISDNALDTWGQGSDLQVAAASRLVGYFPVESKRDILERLSTLDVQLDHMESARLNGVDVYHLICAVGVSDDPDILAAIRGVSYPLGDDRYQRLINAIVKENEAHRKQRQAPVAE